MDTPDAPYASSELSDAHNTTPRHSSPPAARRSLGLGSPRYGDAPGYISSGEAMAPPKQENRTMKSFVSRDTFEHVSGRADFLPGNRVELTVVDGIPPTDPENGDAEHRRLLAISAVARLLWRGKPSLEIYVADPT